MPSRLQQVVNGSRQTLSMKASSQGGRPSGRSRTGRASVILHAVLLPDALARLGSASTAGRVRTTPARSIPHGAAHDPRRRGSWRGTSLHRIDRRSARSRIAPAGTAEVGPDVAFAVQLAPQCDDPCAWSVARQDLVDGIGEVPMWPRGLRFRGFRLHLALHAAGQIAAFQQRADYLPTTAGKSSAVG